MTSKEAFENLVFCLNSRGYMSVEKIKDLYSNHLAIIKQDLERLEQLADNIKIHKETIKMQQNQIESLQSKNEKLEKVIEILKRQNDGQAISQEEYDLLKGGVIK